MATAKIQGTLVEGDEEDGAVVVHVTTRMNSPRKREQIPRLILEDEGDTICADLGSSWRSAKAVASLNHAYSKAISDCKALKVALHASEKRCADLLSLSTDEQKSEVGNAEGSSVIEDLQATVNSLARENEKLKETLNDEREEKQELLQWKNMQLSEEQSSLELMRKALDESGSERASLIKDISDLREISRLHEAASFRTKRHACAAMVMVVKRWLKRKEYRALRSWKAALEDWRSRCHRERIATSFARQIMFRKKARIFRSWLSAVTHKATQRRMYRRLVFQIKRRSLRQICTAWKTHAKERKMLRRTLSRFATFSIQRELARAFWKWQMGTLRKGEKFLRRRLVSNAIENWKRPLATVTWCAWVEFVVEAKRHRVDRQRFIFQAWGRRIRDQRSLHSKLDRFVQRMLRVCAYKAFVSWKAFVKSSKMKKECARRIFNHVRHETLQFWFDKWVEKLNGSKLDRDRVKKKDARERQLLACFAKKWKLRSQRSAFETWMFFVDNRQRLRRFLQKRACIVLREGLEKWKSNLRESEMLTRAMERFGVRAVRNSFMLWKARLREFREADLSTERKRRILLEKKLLQSEERKERMQTKLLNLWRHKTIARCFYALQSHAKEVISDKRAIKTFISKWRHLRELKFFSTWVTFVSARKLAKRYLRRLTFSKLQREMLTAFTLWRRQASFDARLAMHEERMKAIKHIDGLKSKLDLLQLSRSLVCEKVAEKLSSISDKSILAKYFKIFRTNVLTLRRHRKIVRKFSLRWANRSASRAFAAWAQRTQQLRHNRCLMSRMASNMKQVTLATAFRSWRAAVKEQIANRARVMMIFRGKQQLTFWKCFSHWKLFVQDSKAVKHRAKAILADLTQASLCSRFEQWRSYTQDMRTRRRALNDSDANLHRVILRMRRNSLYRAFSSWQACIQKRKFKRQRTACFIRRWQVRLISRVFDTWLDNACDRQRSRVLVGKILARLENLNLHKAFRTWMLFVKKTDQQMLIEYKTEVSRYQGEVSALQQRILEVEAGNDSVATKFNQDRKNLQQHRDIIRERVISLSTGNIFSRAFHSWLRFCQQNKIKKVRLFAVTQRWIRFGRARAFQAWKSYIHRKRWNRALLLRISEKWRSINCLRAFNSLRCNLIRHRERDSGLFLLERYARWIQSFSIAKAWVKWAGKHSKMAEVERRMFAELQHSRRENLKTMLIERGALNGRRRILSRAILAWRYVAKEGKMSRRRWDRLIYRADQSIVRRSFACWANVLNERREKRIRMIGIVLRWKKQHLAKGFTTWFKASSRDVFMNLRKARDDSIVLACWRRSEQSTLHRCFGRWRGLTAMKLKRRRALTLLNRYSRRIINRFLGPAWNRWNLVASSKISFLQSQVVRKGFLECFQRALIRVVCDGVLFPSLQFLQDRSSLSTSKESLWNVINHSLGTLSNHLFDCDGLQAFHVTAEGLVQYDSSGHVARTLGIGNSLTSFVVRLGRAIATMDASADTRFDFEVDGQIHHHENISTQTRNMAIFSPPIAICSPISPPSSKIALIVVPVFDTADRVVGLLQAVKSFPSEIGDEEVIPRENFTDACLSVLTVLADGITVLSQWNQAFSDVSQAKISLDERVCALVDEKENLDHVHGELELRIKSLKKKLHSRTERLSKELKGAYRRISLLEAHESGVSNFEVEVKQLLENFDQAISHTSSTLMTQFATNEERSVDGFSRATVENWQSLSREQSAMSARLNHLQSKTL